MKDKIEKTVHGTVIKNNSAKTITVQSERLIKYPKFGKYIRRNSSYKVHDEKNEAQVGDEIDITETRPLSKSKKWRLLKIIKKASKESTI